MKTPTGVLTWACCVLANFAAGPVFGQSTNHLGLAALRDLRLPDVVLDSVAAVTPDHEANPRAAACVDVKGTIGGHIRFELLLPEAWNGRFVMGGGGGFVGTVQGVSRDLANRGYASAGTDTGHEWQPGYMAGWAYNDLEAQLNFGYLAVHRTAEVAKAIIRAYYQTDIAYAYFLGCSRGGGQAMMEAQRYPNDFDGIVAGAPAFDWTGLAACMVEIGKALYPDARHLDHTALTKEALVKLQAAILEQCDAQDGLKDGVIQDPPSTHFELAKVAGLTDDQRQAIQAIYQGARNARGPIYPGYAPVAECDPDQWIAWLVGPVPPLVAKDHVPDLTFAFGTQIFKGLVFNDPDWDYSTYDLSHFEHDTRLAASFLNATNPDLGGLKVHKGKLILWHGWADPALPAQATVDYYRQVRQHDPAAADYCRLFMVPGCLHCGGGPGASEVDWLSVIVDWVERGVAPERIVASKREHGKVARTRPLYPYPEWAAYRGSGDPDSADSFVARSAPVMAR
ncbi:MAG: tannase/feruloyl esterase family alpha/beta hydrolase [Verrucomicrobia bacterium]|nr:tannase/feruloyl esterase family alpha/beta hydrolase [Verrucomicrobiota bacterium]